jgi:hypothetical protein
MLLYVIQNSTEQPARPPGRLLFIKEETKMSQNRGVFEQFLNLLAMKRDDDTGSHGCFPAIAPARTQPSLEKQNVFHPTSIRELAEGLRNGLQPAGQFPDREREAREAVGIFDPLQPHVASQTGSWKTGNPLLDNPVVPGVSIEPTANAATASGSPVQNKRKDTIPWPQGLYNKKDPHDPAPLDGRG